MTDNPWAVTENLKWLYAVYVLSGKPAPTMNGKTFQQLMEDALDAGLFQSEPPKE